MRLNRSEIAPDDFGVLSVGVTYIQEIVRCSLQSPDDCANGASSFGQGMVSMTMKRLVLLLILGSVLSSCAAPDRSTEFDVLGPFLDSLMLEHEVPGISFAVFDDSGLLYEHVSGLKSQATLAPIDTESAFEAASISKPVFAYVVLSLMREGVLELDAALMD